MRREERRWEVLFSLLSFPFFHRSSEAHDEVGASSGVFRRSDGRRVVELFWRGKVPGEKISNKG